MVIWIIIPASNGLKKTQTKIMLANTPAIPNSISPRHGPVRRSPRAYRYWDGPNPALGRASSTAKRCKKSHADVTVTVTHGDTLSFMIWASCKNAFFLASSKMITFLMATSLSLMFLSRPMKTLAAGAGQNKDLRGGKSMEIIPPMWFFCFDEWIRVYMVYHGIYMVYHGILDCFQFMTFSNRVYILGLSCSAPHLTIATRSDLILVDVVTPKKSPQFERHKTHKTRDGTVNLTPVQQQFSTFRLGTNVIEL